MKEKQAAGFFIEIFIVMAVLGILLAVAIPNIGRMLNNGKAESRESELQNIQAAVTDMLFESKTKTLIPVGPTSNMSEVRTTDTPPLVLTDYLPGLNGDSIKLDYLYIFSANGTVTQSSP